ncbi:MAG: DbpA RNA binding domain-containing protein, partial [Chloroflexota bacterium]|nr:DbpA RNA binding domain-containing protein [Chloroflexota bacterium]
RTVVLDEADEMLNMGFIEDIEAILAQAPPERQTALFSATMPPRVAQLAQRYLNDPVRVSVAIREAVAPQVRQVFYEVPTYVKPDALVRVLDHEEPESAIVFVRTRRDADEVAEKLSGRGYVAQAIHGDLSQSQRERVLGRFRLGHTQLLVATDVAARGLDIPEVSHVINYHLPEDPQIYVHRIGRTGRAGRSGQALTLVTPRERRQLRLIEQATRSRPERLPLPTAEDVATRRRAAFRQEVLRILDAGQLDPFVALVEDLADTRDPAVLAAAAFKMAAQARGSGGTAQARSRTQSPDSPTALDVAPIPGEGQLPAEERARPARRSDDRGTFDGGTQDGARVRIFLRVGHRDNIRPADLVGAIANEAGVPGHVVGDIDIYDTFSFVDIPADLVNQVLGALNQTVIRGREPRAVLARPTEESLERNSRQDPRGRFPQRGPRPGGRDGGDDRHARRGRFTAGPVRRTGRDSDFQRRPPSGDR